MTKVPDYTRRIVSALFLGLLVFILAAKSGHGHPLKHQESGLGQTVVHSGSACLVCEFQFPVSEVASQPLFQNFQSVFIIYSTDLPEAGLPSRMSIPFSERGPPPA